MNVIINFKNGSAAEYPAAVLPLIPGDNTINNVIDADTGAVIYDEAARYIDIDYINYFNRAAVNPLEAFAAAVNI
jgi:hypothetical protein